MSCPSAASSCRNRVDSLADADSAWFSPFACSKAHCDGWNDLNFRPNRDYRNPSCPNDSSDCRASTTRALHCAANDVRFAYASRAGTCDYWWLRRLWWRSMNCWANIGLLWRDATVWDARPLSVSAIVCSRIAAFPFWFSPSLAAQRRSHIARAVRWVVRGGIHRQRSADYCMCRAHRDHRWDAEAEIVVREKHLERRRWHRSAIRDVLWAVSDNSLVNDAMVERNSCRCISLVAVRWECHRSMPSDPFRCWGDDEASSGGDPSPTRLNDDLPTTLDDAPWWRFGGSSYGGAREALVTATKRLWVTQEEKTEQRGIVRRIEKWKNTTKHTEYVSREKANE